MTVKDINPPKGEQQIIVLPHQAEAMRQGWRDAMYFPSPEKLFDADGITFTADQSGGLALDMVTILSDHLFDSDFPTPGERQDLKLKVKRMAAFYCWSDD